MDTCKRCGHKHGQNNGCPEPDGRLVEEVFHANIKALDRQRKALRSR